MQINTKTDGVFFSIFLDVPNVSVHSLKGFSTNLKAENTVNMISMFSLLPAVANVVSYTQSIPNLFPNYSQVILKSFPKYSHIPKIFQSIYPKIILAFEKLFYLFLHVSKSQYFFPIWIQNCFSSLDLNRNKLKKVDTKICSDLSLFE